MGFHAVVVGSTGPKIILEDEGNMPKRTRSHRLEDISIQRVERCLPDRWIVRRKDKDYGVDLEVEIFDESDEATGLIFYAQVKATDDPSKAGALSMKIDRLDYLSSLDSPSIIVRYFSGTDSFRWMWLTNIYAQIGSVAGATATIRFDEETAWSTDDPGKVVRTLQVFRAIRTAPRRLPVGLTISLASPDSHPAYELQCAIADVLDGTRALASSSDPVTCLPITVSFEGDTLSLKIDVISSIAVRLQSLEQTEVLAQLAYAIAYMTSGYEFMTQTRDLAEFIVDRELRCQSREIAAVLAARLIDHPELAAEVAWLNALHAKQDESYLVYVNALLSSALPLDSRLEQIARFYKAALEEHADDPLVQSSVHYSYGNSLRQSQDFRGAMRQYNQARRKNPTYCERAYFLCELAASLYFKGRFAMAGQLYARAHDLEQRAQIAICAGDARLFSGDFSEAIRHYENALGSPDEFERAEGALKIWLATWTLEFEGGTGRGINRNQLGDGTYWREILDDALKAEKPLEVLGACLILCYLEREDSASFWAQAIGTAPYTEEAQLVELVLTCAVSVHGHVAYSLFRKRSIDFGVPAKLFAEMDQLASELNERRRALNREGLTTRLVGESAWDVVAAIDPMGG